MNQKFSDWASIAEIVSGIAVVVTLIFLIAGIRENTAITRAVAYDSQMNSLNEWRRNLSQDEELSHLYRLFNDGEAAELSEDEAFRLFLVLNEQWGIYEKSYYANKYGILGPSEWGRFERQICATRTSMEVGPLSTTRPWANARRLLSEEFAGFVDSRCNGAP
jgi:hypothetical protein